MQASNGNTYECKRDRLAKQTGNVAIEHKALHHSKADWIVYWLDGQEQLLQIPRRRLWEAIEDNWYAGKQRKWEVVRGGEFQDWLTLIPVNQFIALCTLV